MQHASGGCPPTSVRNRKPRPYLLCGFALVACCAKQGAVQDIMLNVLNTYEIQHALGALRPVRSRKSRPDLNTDLHFSLLCKAGSARAKTAQCAEYLRALPRRSPAVPANMHAVDTRNHFADQKAPETTHEAQNETRGRDLGWFFGPGPPKGACEPPRDISFRGDGHPKGAQNPPKGLLD